MMTPTKPMKRKASDLEDTTATSGNESSSPCKMPKNMIEMSEVTWTANECRELIAQLQQNKTLLSKDFRQALKKVDWDAIQVGDHDADSLHQMAEKLTHSVRKYRTLSEVLDDCLTEINKINNNKILRLLIQHPKRPKTPFMDFLTRHIADIKEEFPGVAVTVLAKVAGEKFNQLSEKKKKKYMRRYEGRKEDFAAQMDQLRNEHPEIFLSKVGKANRPRTPKKNTLSDVVQKPKPAKQHYLDVQVDGKMEKHPERSRDELVQKFTKKWSKFSEDEKEPWLLLSADDKLRYQTEIDDCRGDPRFSDEELTRNFARAQLTKNEVNLKLTDLGKPKTPARNGYQYFITEYWSNHRGSKTMHDVLSTTVRVWKEMGVAKKEQYKLLAKLQRNSYASQLEKWREGLSTEDMSLVTRLEAMIPPKKSKTAKKNAMPSSDAKNVKVKMPAFAKKSQEKDERQTTIIDHFSPSVPKAQLLDTVSESSGCESSADKEDSEEYHSPSAASDGDFRSLDDFKISKPVKPRPLLASLGSPGKTNGNDRLTPQIISPMVPDSPLKKLKKKK